MHCLRLTKKIGFAKIALCVLVCRDLWRSTPAWAKPRITRYRRKAFAAVRARVTRSGAKSTDTTEVATNLDDISDFSNLATKIEGVVRRTGPSLDGMTEGKDAHQNSALQKEQLKNERPQAKTQQICVSTLFSIEHLSMEDRWPRLGRGTALNGHGTQWIAIA